MSKNDVEAVVIDRASPVFFAGGRPTTQSGWALVRIWGVGAPEDGFIRYYAWSEAEKFVDVLWYESRAGLK